MNYLQIILISIILSSCALPQFSFKSGGSENKEIDAKTVQVDYFQNKSAIGGPFLGASFTESLRDIMQSQTKLNLVDKTVIYKYLEILKITTLHLLIFNLVVKLQLKTELK